MRDKEALHETIRASMERHAVPGVAVGIYDGGQELTEGFGVTSVENPLPVDSDTLFQIGSITKTVTATAIVVLAERGMVDLDEPVRTYLPELCLADEEVARKVTTAHLLMHVGGWVGDVFEDTGCGDDALEKIVRRLADVPQLAPLGALWSYNNSGFYIAGRVVEVLSGKAFETAVRELVLSPLRMDGSFFFPGEVMTRRFAVGHLVMEGEPSVSRPWTLPRNSLQPGASPPARKTRSATPGSTSAASRAARRSSTKDSCARCGGHGSPGRGTTGKAWGGCSPMWEA
jgi:CubicO group peptidase (beta-lactamase class C family)